MAENNTDLEALKAKKEAEKAAKKAKEERIKQSKPKKEGTAVSRARNAVKKFFKDFSGTCKKIVWPTGKQVLKNSLIVLVTIIIIGAVVALIDFGLTKVFDLGEKGVVALAEYVGGEDETAEGEEETTALIDSGAIADAIQDAAAEAESETDAGAEAETEAETAAETEAETAA